MHGSELSVRDSIYQAPDPGQSMQIENAIHGKQRRHKYRACGMQLCCKSGYKDKGYARDFMPKARAVFDAKNVIGADNKYLLHVDTRICQNLERTFVPFVQECEHQKARMSSYLSWGRNVSTFLGLVVPILVAVQDHSDIVASDTASSVMGWLALSVAALYTLITSFITKTQLQEKMALLTIASTYSKMLGEHLLSCTGFFRNYRTPRHAASQFFASVEVIRVIVNNERISLLSGRGTSIESIVSQMVSKISDEVAIARKFKSQDDRLLDRALFYGQGDQCLIPRYDMDGDDAADSVMNVGQYAMSQKELSITSDLRRNMEEDADVAARKVLERTPIGRAIARVADGRYTEAASELGIGGGGGGGDSSGVLRTVLHTVAEADDAFDTAHDADDDIETKATDAVTDAIADAIAADADDDEADEAVAGTTT